MRILHRFVVFLRIFCIAFLCGFAVLPAMADSCNSNQIETEDGCMDAKFTLTTSATDYFEFHLAASGLFYIDWGDGYVQTINKSSSNLSTYSHEYENEYANIEHTIKFTGNASGYDGDLTPAIRFSTDNYNDMNAKKITGIFGSLGAIFPTIDYDSPSFYRTFRYASNITSEIPENLFMGITSPKNHMFESTFYGCSGLTGSIPENLFADISGEIQNNMFAETFQGCSGLTGSIPELLFCHSPEDLTNGIYGSPHDRMFQATFWGCDGLTGEIPGNLFSCIQGAPHDSMFEGTFAYCSGLNGTNIEDNLNTGMTYAINPQLFAGIDGQPDTSIFAGTFQGCTGLTGSLPTTLFMGVHGSPSKHMFERTFQGCTGLTGFIPPLFFANVSTIGSAENQMSYIFDDTGLDTECPDGIEQYMTGFERYFNGHVSCNVPTPIDCDKGQYLPGGTFTCIDCEDLEETNSFCPGGTYFTSDEDQGLYQCPEAYPHTTGTNCYAQITFDNLVFKEIQKCRKTCPESPPEEIFTQEYYYSPMHQNGYVVADLPEVTGEYIHLEGEGRFKTLLDINTEEYSLYGWYLDPDLTGERTVNGAILSGDHTLYQRWLEKCENGYYRSPTTGLDPTNNDISFSVYDSYTWEAYTQDTELLGQSLCATLSDAEDTIAGTVIDEKPFVSDTDSENKYCWCQIAKPVVSKWVLAFGYSKASTCNSGTKCANQCKTQMQQNQNMRTSLYTTSASDDLACVLETYSIKYYLDGGNNSERNISRYNVTFGEITLYAPTRTGYKFKGWYDNPDFDGDPIKMIESGSTGDRVFYAYWAQQMPDECDEGYYASSTLGLSPEDDVPANQGSAISATEWNSTINGETVIGTAMCAGLSGAEETTTGTVIDEEPVVSETDTDNKYCWCKMTSPGVSNWVLGLAYSKASTCNSGTKCATQCALQLKQSVAMRTGIYNTATTSDGHACLLETYHINYVLDGGVNDSGNRTEYTIKDSQKEIHISSPKKNGYSFAGWYYDEEFEEPLVYSYGAGAYKLDVSTGDITVYAKWDLVECNEDEYVYGSYCRACPQNSHSNGGTARSCTCDSGYMEQTINTQDFGDFIQYDTYSLNGLCKAYDGSQTYTDCNDDVLSEFYNQNPNIGDWRAVFSDTVITGTSACTMDGDVWLQEQTNSDAYVGGQNTGSNCWCKVTSITKNGGTLETDTAPWVFRNYGTNCSGGCTAQCAGNFALGSWTNYMLPDFLGCIPFSCPKNQILTSDGCVDAKFTLTTSATNEFQFRMSAAGTFYVDCSGGTLSGADVNGNKITRTGTSEATYTCSYNNSIAIAHTIRFGGRATGFSSFKSAISFSTDSDDTNAMKIIGISGALGAIFGTLENPTTGVGQPRLGWVFHGASNMLNTDIDDPNNPGKKYALPPTLFDGITGAPVKDMFNGTFQSCSGLTGTIPGNLFAGISGAPAQYMFRDTFNGCSGLTGSIPENLFTGISGTPAESMFQSTFSSCSGLTGSISENLFAGISGAPAERMFQNTFAHCSGLTGSIPENIFAGISGAPARYMFNRTFYNCRMTKFGDKPYIPADFLSGIDTNTSVSDQAPNMFAGTGLDSQCPANMYASTRQQFSDAGKPWCSPCPANYSHSDGVASDISQCYAVVNLYDGDEITENHVTYDAGVNDDGYTIPYLPYPENERMLLENWYDNSDFNGEPVTTDTVFVGDTNLYAKWVNTEFVCESGKWLHLGDDTVACLSETKPDHSQSPIVMSVQIGNKKYYLHATPNAESLPVNEDTNTKLKVLYKNKVYNIHDESVSN